MAFIHLGEHASDFDQLPEGAMGTLENPFTHMIRPIPYGAWFRCSQCDRVCRSTVAFDCFGDDGELLHCEDCNQR